MSSTHNTVDVKQKYWLSQNAQQQDVRSSPEIENALQEDHASSASNSPSFDQHAEDQNKGCSTPSNHPAGEMQLICHRWDGILFEPLGRWALSVLARLAQQQISLPDVEGPWMSTNDSFQCCIRHSNGNIVCRALMQYCNTCYPHAVKRFDWRRLDVTQALLYAVALNTGMHIKPLSVSRPCRSLACYQQCEVSYQSVTVASRDRLAMSWNMVMHGEAD